MDNKLLGGAQKSTFARYLVAIAAPIAALFIRLSFAPLLGDKVPYATFSWQPQSAPFSVDSDLGC